MVRAAVVVVLVALPGALSPVAAAFTARTANSGNSLGAAASFPTYPTAVTDDNPWAYHRSDELTSSAPTSAVVDTSGNNRAGTYSGMTGGAATSTQWNFDDGSGPTAADSSGFGNVGTLAANVGWLANGRSGSAVSFPGGDPATSNYVQGTDSGVATNQSFTVMAWAYPTALGQNRSVLSLGTSVGNAMSLQYSAGAGRWEFVMTPTELTRRNGTVDFAYGGAAVDTDTWVHLAGVYDATAGQLQLYVNGAAQTGDSKAAAWNCVCQLQAGRSRWDGTWYDAFAGYVDQVRTYRSALSAADVAAEYGDSAHVSYDFEEANGTSAIDTSGYHNTGTLGSAVTRTSSGHTGKALAFSADPNAHVSSATAAVDATNAFSVSAWVNLSTGGGANRTVLSQQGVSASTFELKYDQSGRWAFSLAQNSTGTTDQIISAAPADLGQWVHLVAVYTAAGGNASTLRMRLYVNNGTAVTGTHSVKYGSTEPLQVGRAMSSSVWGAPFDGVIDEVRVYRRVLTAAEITTLYTSATPAVSAPMTAGVPGALQGAQQGQQASTAVRFNGSGSAYNNAQVAAPGPNAFTISCWFKTTGGGSIIGYSLSQTGMSAELTDRVIFVDSTGRLAFVVWDTSAHHVTSSDAYNDGAWHHVAATLGALGAKLYVDGNRVAVDATVTYGRNSSGYWRWGGTNLVGFANRPTGDYFTGTLDEIAIYPAQLTDQQIAWQYHANH
ncbi:MAG TPA: LamG domain-containing protein [Micromonosporaceae bacterium]|nr:LamG domain-containing protein [Micromonosporaceae bacterium]